MLNIPQKLAEVRERIAESEQRIAEQHERLRTSSCETVAEAALQLYSAASTLRELHAYEGRLKRFGARSPQRNR